jgi:hypothetical protein
MYYYIIIGIQPLGWSGQRPELSQVTGMLHPGQILWGSLPLLSPAFGQLCIPVFIQLMREKSATCVFCL